MTVPIPPFPLPGIKKAENLHKGTTLTKAEAEEKIKSGKCRHVIKEIGTFSSMILQSPLIRMSEQDLRKAKKRQKMTVGFRKAKLLPKKLYNSV